MLLGFPGSSEVKASARNAGDLGSIPGLGRCPGEGNGNSLQYSCLENPMDGGAWWATVHGVAKSRTRLSDLTFHWVYFLNTCECLRFSPYPLHLPWSKAAIFSHLSCCSSLLNNSLHPLFKKIYLFGCAVLVIARRLFSLCCSIWDL